MVVVRARRAMGDRLPDEGGISARSHHRLGFVHTGRKNGFWLRAHHQQKLRDRNDHAPGILQRIVCSGDNV